jgi:hypothetical protein
MNKPNYAYFNPFSIDWRKPEQKPKTVPAGMMFWLGQKPHQIDPATLRCRRCRMSKKEAAMTRSQCPGQPPGRNQTALDALKEQQKAAQDKLKYGEGRND